MSPTGQPTIAIVDYGAGNLHSVAKAARAAGLAAAVTGDPGAVAAAPAIILPGVGAFAQCMAELAARGLIAPLRAHLAAGRPLLGICLGLQVLFEHGEEGDGAVGLGYLPGTVRRLEVPGLKVPHMGWNAVSPLRSSALLDGIPPGAHFYFVHSYQAVAKEPADVLAVTDYGGPVTAAVERGRTFAVQFHPEKSSAAGLRLLRNFAALVGGGAA